MNVMADETEALFATMAGAARAAAASLARTPDLDRRAALGAAAAAIREASAAILAANADDLGRAREGGLSAAFVDRLALSPARIATMADGVAAVGGLPDPLARDLGRWRRPNGLEIRRVPQPLGVIGMIFESRPNVTADAGAIAIRAGNAVILRGGSEVLASARAIGAAMQAGLASAGLPAAAVQVAPTAARGFVGAMLAASGLLDLIIPRGGKALVRRVEAEARVPVLAHAEGLCHTYVHAAAAPAMAEAVLLDAKLRRPGICGATETLLIDAAVAPALLPRLVAALAAGGCTFRACVRTRAILPDLPAATAEDFRTEWLDRVLSIRVVDDIDAALAHIRSHGSEHTEAIITEDQAAAEKFLAGIDSAVCMWNASTQFCDGGEFGFGAEIGIATGRLHARGPVGPDQLTTFRYHVIGSGQVRG